MAEVRIEHHQHDTRFVNDKMRRLPKRWHYEIGRQYSERFADSRRDANLYLLDISARAGIDSYRLAASDDDLVDEAKAAATAVRDAIDATYSTKGREAGFTELSRGRFAFNPIGESPYKWCVEYAKERGVEPPIPYKEKITESGCIERMKDQVWWRRAFRKNHGRRVEGAARKLGFVHKGAGIYSSDETLYRRKGQKSRNRKMLEEMLAINEMGDQYTLADLADLSVSNPAIRRGELMVRIRGFETIADDLGHKGLFVTLTCPSRFHSHTIRNRQSVENPKYDGSTPRDAQAYLQKVWTRIRAKLARHGLTLYGFRVAEPNHDGCVHWHLLVFAPGWGIRRIKRTFIEHGLADSPNEPGAQAHRVTFVEIDPAKGSATGYIAKYVSKNIDGHAIENDLFGNDVIDTIERVEAWRSCWGVRQFQQLGGPPVTVWRELRRIEGEESGILETARDAADRGDWAAFVQAMGGPTCPRKSQPVKLAKATDLITLDESTGEVVNASPVVNKYGEPAAAQIIGVSVGDQITATRWHQWELVRDGNNRQIFQESGEKVANQKPSSGYLGGNEVGVGIFRDAYLSCVGRGIESLEFYEESSLSGAHAPPWSSVNNCTRQCRKGLRNDESSRTNVEGIRAGMEDYPDVHQGGGRWPHNRPGNRRDDSSGG